MRSRTGSPTCAASRSSIRSEQPEATATAGRYRDLGAAPDFTGTQRWFNTPGDKPLDLAGLRGRVVLIDFWTYTCINCIRTLPYVKAWDKRYRGDGLTIVGVHTPEFGFEHEAGNVERAIEPERHPLPGRPGQRLRHLERVGQPVLAGEVPDRCRGPRALLALRRGRLPQDRGARSARCSPSATSGRLGAFARAKADRPRRGRSPPPRPTSGRRRHMAGPSGRPTACANYRRVRPSRAAAERVRARRQVAGHARGGDRRRERDADARRSWRARSSSSCARAAGARGKSA